MRVFSVYDSAAKAYLQPFFTPAQGQAIRSFSDAVNEPGHQFNRHPQDYTLFELGTFDEETGILVSITPKSLGNGVQFELETARELSAGYREAVGLEVH